MPSATRLFSDKTLNECCGPVPKKAVEGWRATGYGNRKQMLSTFDPGVSIEKIGHVPEDSVPWTSFIYGLCACVSDAFRGDMILIPDFN